jgi:hypothetical protein
MAIELPITKDKQQALAVEKYKITKKWAVVQAAGNKLTRIIETRNLGIFLKNKWEFQFECDEDGNKIIEGNKKAAPKPQPKPENKPAPKKSDLIKELGI